MCQIVLIKWKVQEILFSLNDTCLLYTSILSPVSCVDPPLSSDPPGVRRPVLLVHSAFRWLVRCYLHTAGISTLDGPPSGIAFSCRCVPVNEGRGWWSSVIYTVGHKNHVSTILCTIYIVVDLSLIHIFTRLVSSILDIVTTSQNNLRVYRTFQRRCV